jgi:hypothetical protein
MIIGDSRSFQGIQPKVLDSCLAKSKYSNISNYNFSFTIAQASYGPSYLQAIKRKVDTAKNTDGLFIISVNPWVLANRKPNNKIESDKMFKNMPPHNMKMMSKSPNFEYLVKNFNYFHFKSIFRKNNKLHKDGWLEENNLPKDKKTFIKWKANQIRIFEEFSNDWKKSDYRLEWLSNTINFLNKHGNVVLVRMPVDSEILNIEAEFWNDFDKDIIMISDMNNVEYLNFTKTNIWKTYDGHHLDKFGGKLFSIELSRLISN